jgi:exosortase/archaeosortase
MTCIDGGSLACSAANSIVCFTNKMVAVQHMIHRATHALQIQCQLKERLLLQNIV